MAFDKAKTLYAAEKALELGKIPAAIDEYCQIVENEPDDFTALNMLGDLHSRVGNAADAVTCFIRIAEHYREQEFIPKAIAMYKKVDRLRPNDPEIANNLARLYAVQGLLVEARAQYLLVANAHTRANETQKALEVLGQIADLDPQNTDIRIKLAEGYLKEGMRPEAVVLFAQAGERLLARGAFDQALEVYSRSLEIESADQVALTGLLAVHRARGTPDEAAETIERVSAENPDNAELLSLLATAYVEAEQAFEAETATAALVSKQSSSYLKYLDVARLYLKMGKAGDALRVLGGVADQALFEQEGARLLEIVEDALAGDADNVEALRLLVRVYWRQREADKLESALERLVEAAQAAGLEKEERYALTQLTRLFPEMLEYLDRLKELGGPEEDAADMLPDFDSVQETPVAQSAGTVDEHPTETSPPPVPAAPEEFTIEWNSLANNAAAAESATSGFTSGFEIGYEAVTGEQSPRELLPADQPVVADVDPRIAEIRARELESVDFYIAQGYVEIAIDTLDLLEKQYGPHVDIELRRSQLTATPPSVDATLVDLNQPATTDSTWAFSEAANAAEAPEPMMAEVEAGADFGEVSVEPTPAMVPPAPAAIHPGLAEVFEEFRVLAEGEAGTNGDYETHYNLGLAYKEMDLFEEALEEFQVAVGLTSVGDGTSRYLQCCNLLGHCFLEKGEPRLALTWFNKGLTAPGHSDDEYQALRFDLGSAYEQMGDIDHALEIFTEIYGVNISYRGVKDKVRDLQSRLGTSREPGQGSRPSPSSGEKIPPVNGKPHRKADQHATRD